MPFHETNRGYVSGNYRYGGNTLFPQNRQPKIGEANAPVRDGYLYYISGGLAASGNISAMTNTQDDYQINGANPNTGVWIKGGPQATAVACNNYADYGTSLGHGSNGNNGMVECNYKSELEHFSHKMCWGADDCNTMIWFFSDAAGTNYLGQLYFYATGGYYNNWIRLYDSSSLTSPVANWDNNYTGTHAARFSWDIRFYSNGLYCTQRANNVSSGAAGTIDMRGYGLNLPSQFYISFWCRIYSSYCNSCTADNWTKMHFNKYA